jgi:lipid A 3-O-deacylase
VLATAMLLLVAPATIDAQWFQGPRSFTLHEENDALSKTTDESYTQGLRLSWDFSQWPEWAGKLERKTPIRHLANFLRRDSTRTAFIACTPQVDRASHPCGSIGFAFGQVIYTPADLIERNLQVFDRPYAGWLFGSMTLNVRDGPLQTTTEAVVGIIGPQSHGQSFQSAAHWTFSTASEEPQGWKNQLGNSLHAGFITSAGWHAFEWCGGFARMACSGVYAEKRRFDITPRVELVATTAMTRASAGMTVRAGANFSDAAVGQRIAATGVNPAPGRRWWWVVFGTADARAVGHSAVLDGSYTDRGTNEWHQQRRIVSRNLVNEWAGGFGIGNRAGGITFQRVSRTEEFDLVDPTPNVSLPAGRHTFASVTFSINVF